MSRPDRIQIPFPFGGLNDNVAYSAQPPNTTAEAQNVRGQDPKTGRIRGGQRSGLSKFVATQLNGSTKPADLTALTYDQKTDTHTKLDGSAGGDPMTVDWTTKVPSKKSCKGIASDRQDNAYALNGTNGVTKYNADGTQLWSVTMPTDDSAHEINVILVDDFDVVYAAVSSGGSQRNCRIWAYQQEPDDKVQQLWQIEVDWYVTDMKIKDGRLFTLQDDHKTQRSRMVAYTGISTATPFEDFDISTNFPYPTNGIAIKDDGDIVTCHEPFAGTGGFRGYNPESPNTHEVAQGWTPLDLDNVEENDRIWCWLDGQDIDGQGNATLEDGDEVFTWKDKSGHGRHAYSTPYTVGLASGSRHSPGGVEPVYATNDTTKPPTFDAKALSGLPGLFFNGRDSALVSGRNPGITQSMADQQRSLLPQYTDSQFCLFMVVRPASKTGNAVAVTDSSWILSQDNTNGGGTPADHGILVNRTSATAYGSTATDGRITCYTPNDGLDTGTGGGNQPADGTFLNNAGVAIVTFLCDGGVDTGSSSGKTRSLWRVNGTPLDRWTNRANTSFEPTFLGWYNSPTVNWSPYLGHILEILVLDKQDRTLTTTTNSTVLSHPEYPDTSQDDTSDTEMEKIEGYLAWKWGVSAYLEDLDAIGDPAGASNAHNHPYERGNSSLPSSPSTPALIPQNDDSTALESLVDDDGLLAKWREGQGHPIWVINNKGGVGYGLDLWPPKVDDTQDILSVGPDIGGDVVHYRRIQDDGDTVATTGGSTFSSSFGGGGDPNNKYMRPKVCQTTKSAVIPLKYDQDANSVTFRVRDINGSEDDYETSTTAGTELPAYAVALPSSVPNYESDIAANARVPEWVYVAMDKDSRDGAAATDQDTVKKVRLVRVDANSNTPRLTKYLGVSGGDIVTFTSSAVATPTGGSSALDSSSQYIESVVFREEAWWTDGTQLKVYKPKDDEVEALTATSPGASPDRASLIFTWAGRLGVARLGGAPDDFWLSKIGDGREWDLFPPVITQDQSVRGTVGRAGEVPDIINTVIPYTDDILVIGGDHSIYMLRGNPIAGGQVDLVSDITGMSFGRPWCKDPEGRVYFFGSRGGVYVMTPTGEFTRLTVNTIERRMADIDLSAYYIRLAYNWRDEGLHVFQVPFGSGGTIVNSWFYEIKTGSWWEDKFGATDVQPTAVSVLDGDTSADRILVVGCEDGYVRKWDEDADDDDGNRIDSFVTVGPILPPSVRGQARFTNPSVVLERDQGGCNFEFMVSDDPTERWDPVERVRLTPGRNEIRGIRARGSYAWVRLRNAHAKERWALEDMGLSIFPAGRNTVNS